MEDDDDWRNRDDDTKRELENIMLQMNKTADKSLDSTRQMVRMCEESTETGAKTLVMLNEQGEQLERTEQRLDEGHEHLKEASKNLDQLEKCCGCCIMPWKHQRGLQQKNMANNYNNIDSQDAKRREKEAKQKAKEEEKAAKKAGKKGASDPIITQQPQGQQEFITRITNDAREDEMNENLNDVSNMLQTMKQMGQDMGKEISKQNEDIDRIKMKATMMDDQTNLANKRANRVLRDQ